MSTGAPTRVAVYIDGFNLYFGLRDKGWRQLYWLDIHKLAKNLLKPDQTLASVKYFTTRISGPAKGDPPGKRVALLEKLRRQKTFLEAIEDHPEVGTFYGHYLRKAARCFQCGNTWTTYEEKMTDVNLAVEMLADAFSDKYDLALLVSGDSDLTAPVRAVRNLFPQKRIIIAFPPARNSVQLRNAANSSFVIGRAKLAASQFAENIVKSDGHVLRRPDQWS